MTNGDGIGVNEDNENKTIRYYKQTKDKLTRVDFQNRMLYRKSHSVQPNMRNLLCKELDVGNRVSGKAKRNSMLHPGPQKRQGIRIDQQMRK